MDHTITRKLLALGIVAGLGLALTACGDDDDDSASSGGSTTENEANEYGDNGGSTTTAGESSGGGDATLDVSSLQYTDVSAPAGGTLEIDNSSGAPHTFTSDDDAFESVDVASDGATDVPVPSEPGEYPFHCEIHPSMQATLTVQ